MNLSKCLVHVTNLGLRSLAQYLLVSNCICYYDRQRCVSGSEFSIDNRLSFFYGPSPTTL